MVPEGDFEVGRSRGRGYIERGYSIQSLKGGKGDHMVEWCKWQRDELRIMASTKCRDDQP